MKLPSLALENGIPSVLQLKLVKEMNLVCNLYETEDTILLGTSENIFCENVFVSLVCVQVA
jgi:hypothetical protein